MCSQTCDEQTASVCHVTFPETTVVPAYCQMQLSTSASKEGRVHGDVILEPEGAFVEQHGLVVAHSLARSVEGKTVVQLLNPSPEEYQSWGTAATCILSTNDDDLGRSSYIMKLTRRCQANSAISPQAPLSSKSRSTSVTR